MFTTTQRDDVSSHGTQGLSELASTLSPSSPAASDGALVLLQRQALCHAPSPSTGLIPDPLDVHASKDAVHSTFPPTTRRSSFLTCFLSLLPYFPILTSSAGLPHEAPSSQESGTVLFTLASSAPAQQLAQLFTKVTQPTISHAPKLALQIQQGTWVHKELDMNEHTHTFLGLGG